MFRGLTKPWLVRRSFKEQEWRHIVQTPISGKAYQPRRLASHERLHPLVRMLGVVDGCPFIPIADIVGLEVTMHEVMIVLDALLQQKPKRRGAVFPIGRDVAGWSAT